MNEITIPGNKRSDPKTFTVGQVYEINIRDWNDAIVRCIEIGDKIIFEDIITKKIYRSPISQFDRKTSTATNVLETTDYRRQSLVKEALTLTGVFYNIK